MNGIKGFVTILLGGIMLTACYFPNVDPVQSTPRVDLDLPNKDSPTPQEIEMPTATPQPSATPGSVHLTATVWKEMPQVPILMYHRFNPSPGAISSNYNITMTDFDGHLNALYNAGFSLISLNDWLRGEIHIPEGRRPLIITIDDLFYADQISLDEHGQPASYSGVGRLWHFSQEKSEFNFHVALFYNFGDKGYSNVYENGSFFVNGDWRKDRAEAIAWGIEQGAIPFNHFYDHPFLNRLSPDEIFWQLEANEEALREALETIGRENLAANLPNILALPYVIWPSTEAGKQVLFNYTSPEGAPVTAILEGDYASNIRLFESPFSSDFDPWHVPRGNATWEAIQIILKWADEIPVAARCELGAFPGDGVSNTGQIIKVILDLTEQGACPMGYYIVGQFAFHVTENGIIQLSP